MGSYITGVIIAMAMIFGLYATLETTAGRSVFAQDKFGSTSPEELREQSTIEPDFTSADITGDLQNRVEAILQLGENPGELKETVPLLARLAAHHDESVKNAGHAALNRIGEPATPFIREFLDRDTLQNNRYACSAIRAIGSSCKIYLPEVRQLLLSKEKIDRRCGLYALQGLGTSGTELMEQIIACVGDEDFNNQCSACRILETYGSEAEPAAEALLKLLEDGNPSTRGWAAVCLGGIGATEVGGKDVPKLLASKLDAINPIEVQRVLKGLGLIGPGAIDVLDEVKKKVNHKDGFVRCHAAYAVWRISQSDELPFKLLGEMMSDDNLAPEALDLIGRMGAQGLPLLDSVISKLDSSEAAVRDEAAVTIGRMGPGASRATKRLEQLSKDEDALVRVSARRAIEKITPQEK